MHLYHQNALLTKKKSYEIMKSLCLRTFNKQIRCVFVRQNEKKIVIGLLSTDTCLQVENQEDKIVSRL